jgi:hypothetical protein
LRNLGAVQKFSPRFATSRLLAVLSFVAAAAWAQFSHATVAVAHPYQGVTYIVRSELLPRNVTMHIVQVDLSAPGIRFKLTPPGGTRDTVRQTTLDFLNQEHAQVAINCHFMLPFPSLDPNANLVGLAASNGRLYSPFEPQPIGPNYVDQGYAIVPYAPALNIGRGNRVTIVHPNPVYPSAKRVAEPVRLWNTVSGSAQIVTRGVKTIPSYAGSLEALKPLNGYSDAVSWYERARARTAIGVTADNKTLVLFTVDEAGGSGGMAVGEVADVLINDYQVYDALNLDGGGSTTMALQDPLTQTGRIVNVSSDNPLGRASGSNLAVFARPAMFLTCTTIASKRIMLSWPSFPPGWRLQESSDFAHWTTVSKVPQQVGNHVQIVFLPREGNRFYRLTR